MATLDYYFRDALAVKVYEGRREHFSNLDELRQRISYVWNDIIIANRHDARRKAIDQFCLDFVKLFKTMGWGVGVYLKAFGVKPKHYE